MSTLAIVALGIAAWIILSVPISLAFGRYLHSINSPMEHDAPPAAHPPGWSGDAFDRIEFHWPAPYTPYERSTGFRPLLDELKRRPL